MNEQDEPKRKIWQFHLSTAVLLCLYCGGIRYLNSASRSEVHEIDYEDDHGIKHPTITKMSGWPLVIKTYSIHGEGMIETKYIVFQLINMLITIAGFCVIAIGSERHIRRREARKT